MAQIKLLIAAVDMPPAEKGDVVEVIGDGLDWGTKTVAPSWIRLTVTNVPGSQSVAEARARDYLASWGKAFKYSRVASPTPGLARYRIEMSPELDDLFSMETKLDLRDAILAETEGTIVVQTKRHIELETAVRPEINILEAIVEQFAYRRYRFPDSMVDSAMLFAVPGDVVEFTRPYSWVTSNVVDKLR